MAFELDFNSYPAEQKVDNILSKLEQMTAAASRAAASLAPPPNTVKSAQAMAEAHEKVAKSLDKVATVSKSSSKQMQDDVEKSETGVKRFFNSLDKSITDSSHKVNAWRGTYGGATQAMIKANQSLKREALELAKAQEIANKAMLAQAKQVNSQLVAEERQAQDKRTRDWTDYYAKQEAQLKRYGEFMKRSQDVWVNAHDDKRQRLANQMKKISEQEFRDEQRSANLRTQLWSDYYSKQEAQINRYSQFMKRSQDVWTKAHGEKRQRLADQMKKISEQEVREERAAAAARSKLWSDYYAKQEAQIDRYNAALVKSRTIVAKSQAAQIKAANSSKTAADSMLQANQATAAFRAGVSALGTSFGIYTSGTFAAAMATYALVSAMRNTLLIGAEFEKSMYRVYAVTGQTGEVYKRNGEIIIDTNEKVMETQNRLEKAARDAAKTTIFSATESAEGLVALGMAGLSAEQSIGALTPSLRLAQIGMIDVYESADIMTNVMLGFGMKVQTVEEALESATHVTDVLASAITNSNSTIKEMSKSLSYVAPIAHAAGAKIEETVAALETFHNVGIKGQRAGTSLRRAYVNLLEPTDKVATKFRELGVSIRTNEGRMRSLTDIMQDLRGASASVGDLVTIFGVRAAPAMVSFMNNLDEIIEETRRLREEADGASFTMAEFMASSTDAQWELIGARIRDNFLKAFEEAEPAVRSLNVQLMKFIDEDLDGMFKSLGKSISTAAEATEELVKGLSWIVNNSDVLSAAITPGKEAASMAYDIGARLGTRIAKGYEDAYKAVFGPDGIFFGDIPKTPTPTFSGMFDTKKLDELAAKSEEVNKQTSVGVLMTEEMVAEQARLEEAKLKTLKLDEIDNELLKQRTLLSSSMSARRQMDMTVETTNYQQKLGLITEEQAMQRQLEAANTARNKIEQEYQANLAKVLDEKAKIRQVNTGNEADLKAYAVLTREQRKLDEQRISQLEQLDKKTQSLTLRMQEATLKEQGFRKLSTQVGKFSDKLEVANAKLEGNKQAADENTLAHFKNAVSRREAFMATDAFLKLTEDQQQAFKNETDAIKAQIPALDALITKNKELTAADKARKEQEKVVKQFGRGKGLSSEGQGTMKYIEEIRRLEAYEQNKQQIMQQYGVSELEFHMMIVEAKKEADQTYWDSQHENLAKWRDASTKAFADNLTDAIMIRQRDGESDEEYAERYKNRWKVAAQEVSRTMLSTFINTMAQTAAEYAANHLMKMMFTTKEMSLDTAAASNKMALDTAVTTNKVTGEAAKQTAVAGTAATEAVSGAASLQYFAQLLGMGPMLAAAWAPAAMFINMASFGAAGTAAAASALMAGVATGAAGLIAGAGGAAGEAMATSGSRQFGGSVSAGNSYLVGESGREIFTPATNGYITSGQDTRNVLSGGGKGGDNYYITYSNQYTIDARGNEDIEERLEDAIETASNRGLQKMQQDIADGGNTAALVRKASRS